MEQKVKKYEDLNKYERAMTNASLEQRLEGMANDLMQMAKALRLSIHVNTTFHDWQANNDPEKTHASATVYVMNGDDVIKRDVQDDGDLFGIIDEALSKKSLTE